MYFGCTKCNATAPVADRDGDLAAPAPHVCTAIRPHFCAFLCAAASRGKGIAAEVGGKEVLVKPAARGVHVFERNSGKMMLEHLYPYDSLVSWEPSKHGFSIKTIDGSEVSFTTPSGARLCDAISHRKNGHTAPSAPSAASRASEPPVAEKKESDEGSVAVTATPDETIGKPPRKSAPAGDQDAATAGLSQDDDLDALAAELDLDGPDDIEAELAKLAEGDGTVGGPDTPTDLDDMMAELERSSGDEHEDDDLDAMMAALG